MSNPEAGLSVALFAAVLLGAGVVGARQAVPTEVVRQQERVRAEALRIRDVSALERLLASDYRDVDVRGRVHTRTEALVILPDLPATEKMTVAIRDNAAIVIGREGDARVLRVWIQEFDAWRLVVQQATRIRPGASAASPSPELLATPRMVRAGSDDPRARDVLAAQDALDLANALNDIRLHEPFVPT